MSLFDVDIEHAVSVPCGKNNLDGLLYIPEWAIGLVIFAHGSGSSRFSARNQYVARIFNQAKLATLLFDLLTPAEDELDNRTSELRFNIPLLASRCVDVADWCAEQPSIRDLHIGFFGASTGGGAALMAAAMLPSVKAVVSRGGRPDLAGDSLSQVKAPTLFIVGGEDQPVIVMNQAAQAKMHCVTHLEMIPGASHLFEEPGALDKVAMLANKWFVKYL